MSWIFFKKEKYQHFTKLFGKEREYATEIFAFFTSVPNFACKQMFKLVHGSSKP
jgi:hypothetical protein